MAKDYSELAIQIVDLVGGKENITFFTHCITRLRFEVKNKNDVKTEKIKELKGILGEQWSGNQYQIIIGNDVTEVYDTIINQTGLQIQDSVDENLDVQNEKNKFSINTFFEVLSGCMVPVLPALCAAGVVKGILVILTNYLGMTTDSGIYTMLNTVGDVAFYFMPMLVAYTAAKKFRTNVVVALLIAGVFLHPNISGLAGSELNVLGVNMHILNYASTVFPIMISIWVMSYVYKFVDKYIPSALKFVLTPSLTVLIMAPLCLGLFGPIGYYVGYYLATALSKIFYINSFIGGFILGVIRPFVLLTGMQTTFTPIIMNNLATLEYDYIMPVHSVFAMCCCGLSIGAYLRAKFSKGEIAEEKDNFMSSFISAFAGISEPALYGNAFRFKSQLLALVLSSGICGAITAGLGAKFYTGGNPMWLFIVGFGDTAGLMVVMFIVSFVVTAALSFAFGFGDLKFGKRGE